MNSRGATLFNLVGERAPGVGRDLLPLARGDATGRAWPEEAFGWYESYNGHSFALRGIRTPEWRYSFNPQAEDERYDLRADPAEPRNRAPDPECQPQVERLRARLFAWMRREEDPLAEGLRDLPRAGSL